MLNSLMGFNKPTLQIVTLDQRVHNLFHFMEIQNVGVTLLKLMRIWILHNFEI